jgi:hypothetical protein
MTEVQELQRDGKPQKVQLELAKAGVAEVSTTTRFDIVGASEDGDWERNSVFTSLVTSDTDVVGLVAYSIYKQNKHDFLVAYARARGREPGEGELSAYILGEGTPRRLAIYRHLANATLEGKGPDVQVAAGAGGGLLSRVVKGGGLDAKLLWANLLLLVALFAYLLFRFGLR